MIAAQAYRGRLAILSNPLERPPEVLSSLLLHHGPGLPIHDLAIHLCHSLCLCRADLQSLGQASGSPASSILLRAWAEALLQRYL